MNTQNVTCNETLPSQTGLDVTGEKLENSCRKACMTSGKFNFCSFLMEVRNMFVCGVTVGLKRLWL